jgi:hypothetical protein
LAKIRRAIEKLTKRLKLLHNLLIALGDNPACFGVTIRIREKD